MNLLYCIFLEFYHHAFLLTLTGVELPVLQHGLRPPSQRNRPLHGQGKQYRWSWGLARIILCGLRPRLADRGFEIAIETHRAGSGEHHGEIVAPWK